MISQIRIENLSLMVHIGCSEKERSQAQEVHISFSVGFKEPPPGEITDQIEQTLCYGQMCKKIKALVRGQEYHLIEKLAKDCWNTLKEDSPQVLVQVTVKKVTPPIEGLLGGAIYTCGDPL